MPFSIADIVLTLAAVLLAVLAALSIRSGHLALYPSHVHVSRAANPVVFWISIALQSVAAIALFGIVVS